MVKQMGIRSGKINGYHGYSNIPGSLTEKLNPKVIKEKQMKKNILGEKDSCAYKLIAEKLGIQISTAKNILKGLKKVLLKDNKFYLEDITIIREGNSEFSIIFNEKMSIFSKLKKVDKHGFDMFHKHIETGTYFDPYGFDYKGIHQETHGIYDEMGFDRNGIHNITKEKINKEGFDRDGFDKNGYNKEGFDRDGFDKNGYNKEGFDRDGFDKNGYNKEGFDRDGFNRKGFDRDGYNIKGLNKFGFNRKHIHFITGTKRDKQGYDYEGKDKNGLTRIAKDSNFYDNRADIYTPYSPTIGNYGFGKKR